MFNIKTSPLEPSSPGEWLDALIISNIRMWHLQEKVYELDNLERSSKEDLFQFLKEATWMNLQRTQALDALDVQFAKGVLGAHFAPPEAGAGALDEDFRGVWERP